MTIQFNWVNDNGSNRGNSAHDSVVVTKNKGGMIGEERRFAAAITFPIEVMRAARFVVGDRALVGVAHDSELGRCIAIKRVVSGGHKIGPATSKVNAKPRSSEGQCIRGRLQMMWTDDMHEGFEAPKENIKILEDGTLIVWEGLK